MVKKHLVGLVGGHGHHKVKEKMYVNTMHGEVKITKAAKEQHPGFQRGPPP